MRKYFALIFCFTFTNLFAQQVITIAGIPEIAGSSDGLAFEATFNNPHGLAVDDLGNVYVADRFGHKIRKYAQDGNVTTIAGSGLPGNADGMGLSASFNEPWGICVDNDGNILVADTRNNLIRKITPNGEVTTIAGSGVFGSSDGQGLNASFGNPSGLEIDEDGNLYVADHLTHIIRKISQSGYVSTLAGVPGIFGHSDGNGANALFNRPYGLTIDYNGDVLVADEWNHRIRRVTPTGDVSTIAGSGIAGHVNGQAFDAAFNFPWDITVDLQGNIFIADGYNHVIRKLEPTGSVPESYEVITYAGNPDESGNLDGFGLNARFMSVTNIDFRAETGEIYIADAYNNLLKKVFDIDRPPLNLQVITPVFLNPDEPTLCSNAQFEIEVSPDSFDLYTFYINNEIVQNSTTPVYSTQNLPDGNVSITVVGTDNLGSIVSNTINIEVQDIEIEDFIIDKENLSDNNNLVNFEPTVNDPEASFYWDFGDVDSGADNFSSLENPSHLYSGPGSYSVSLIVENNNGCQDTLLKEDLIYYRKGDLNSAIFIPSAFTPNGDGKNDILYVRGEEIEEVEFYIYNQWGQLVFESRAQNEGWDGYFKGKAALNCTYTYLVKARLITNEEIVRSGHVSIIR
jgi:gliding motility-associated-like protein